MIPLPKFSVQSLLMAKMVGQKKRDLFEPQKNINGEKYSNISNLLT